MIIWKRYETALRILAEDKLVTLPAIPPHCKHNAHLFYMLMRTYGEQSKLLMALKEIGIGAVFHYVPLHSSDAGKKFGRIGSAMTVTDDLANRLIRLPIYPDLTEAEVGLICKKVIGLIELGKH